MALRVGGMKKMAPMEESVQPEQVAPEETMPETDPNMGMEMGTEGQTEGGMLDPTVAGYKTPDQGPFLCANCVYFGAHGDNTCAIVSGPIDESGICNVFSSGSGTGETPEEESAEPAEEEATETPEAETKETSEG